MVKTSVMVGKLAVYANASTKNIKVGSKGKAIPADKFFGSLPKSEARKIRKLLHRNGFGGIAAMKRAA